MKLLCSRHSWIKLKDRGTGAASVLPVCNVESVLTALESYTSQQTQDIGFYYRPHLHFANEKGEI